MLPASGIMVFETENRPETRSTQKMLPLEQPDRIHVAFDDHRLVANAEQHARLIDSTDLPGTGRLPGSGDPRGKLIIQRAVAHRPDRHLLLGAEAQLALNPIPFRAGLRKPPCPGRRALCGYGPTSGVSASAMR